jgi:hypothetical protein
MVRTTCIALTICALSLSAAAQSLAGHIVNSLGQPVGNVAVILSNGAPTGTTDASGNFLITGLRNRVYTIQLDPHNNFLDAQQFDFSVSGAANFGTRTLGPAFPVSARFVGPTGAGLLGINMNAYRVDTGAKLFTPHDGSDVNGNVIIGAPANTPVRIRAVPPVGSTLVPFEQPMTLTAAVNLGTQTLRQGFAVTGTVVDQINNLPIAGSEIITTNMLTGEIVLQLNKLTNAVGAFSALLPFGLYEIDIVPPLGNLHHARQLLGVPVLTAGTSFGLIGLERGFQFTATVRGPAGPVAGCDIDLFTEDGYKLFTPHDNTSAAGTFAVIIPPGNYSVRVDPPVANGLLGTHTGLFSVTTNTSGGIINLLPGVPMSVDVRDFNAQPLAGAQVEFKNPVTGEKIVTPGSVSDATGHINGLAPLGSWNVSLSGPQGSLVKTIAFDNVPVLGPIAVPVFMPRKNAVMDMQTFGPNAILSIPNGAVLPIAWSFQNPDGIHHPVFVSAGVVLPSGAEVPLLPPVLFDLPAASGATLQLQVPMPVLPAAELGRIQRFVCRFLNPGDLSVVEQAHIFYVPQ